ncbi:hypothetical protein [Methylobacterium sp. CCH5-D2]|nr:hypothetical protein [Methylobacterium sp. CCH5-D2]
MGYIIAGANLDNKEEPSVAHQIETAVEAWEKISALQSAGY